MNENSKCVDVILKSHDKIDVVLENGLKIEIISKIADIFDINDFIGEEFEIISYNKKPELWNFWYHDINCVMSNDKNIYLVRGKGDFDKNCLNMLSDWLDDGRKDTILSYFEVESLKEISRDDLLNFIKTIEERCECCGEILNDDDWDNWSGTYWQPPECNGYHCSHCGETVKF